MYGQNDTPDEAQVKRKGSPQKQRALAQENAREELYLASNNYNFEESDEMKANRDRNIKYRRTPKQECKGKSHQPCTVTCEVK